MVYIRLMTSTIEQVNALYEEFFAPSLNVLWGLVKERKIPITKANLKKWLDGQDTEQIFRRQRKSKQKRHIVAKHPNTYIQMDIVDMVRWKPWNNGFSYILVIIDVFTRQGYAYVLKQKSIKETTQAMRKFFSKEFTPQVIVSDNDSAFLGKQFQDLLKAKGVRHYTNNVTSHSMLAIVDRFIQTLKSKLVKYLERTKTKKWVHILSRVVDAYNKTPHSGVLNFKPDNIDEDENQKIAVTTLNSRKEDVNNKITFPDVLVGDKVRIQIRKEQFRRSFDPVYSKEVFDVIEVKPTTVKLKGVTRLIPRNWLLVVPNSSETVSRDEVSNFNKQLRRMRATGLVKDTQDLQSAIALSKRKRTTRTSV